MTNRGVTPTYSLPYPGDADIPDVPKDISSLALATDAALKTVATNAATGASNTAAAQIKALASGTWGSGYLAKFGTGSTGIWGSEVYFDPSGKLRSRPEIIEGGKFSAAAAPGSYPLGLTLMGINATDATAGKWPDNVSCFVLTMRRAGDSDTNMVGGQLWFKNSASLSVYDIRYRGASGGPSVWGAWKQLVADGLQTITDYGLYTFNVTHTNFGDSKAVVFTANRFTATPVVMVTTETTAPENCFAGVTSVTKTGCILQMYRTTNNDTTVHYIATQTS